MAQYEITKKLLYPRAVFCDDKIIIERRNKIVEIPIDTIERMEYCEPSFWNFFLSAIWLGLGDAGGLRPGIIYIYFLCNGKRKMCAVKPKKNEVYKLPIFFKVKMGLCEEWEENRQNYKSIF